MKIMASGDHHFDQHSRFDECLRVHRWIAEEVARQQPAVFLSAGDLYERASTPIEREAVAEWLTAIAETCPVVISKGNHDRMFDCALLSRLRTRHPVIVQERCGVHIINGVAIAAVAWPNRASIAQMIGKALPPEAVDDVARGLLGDVFRGLGQELAKHDGPRVLLAHAMIDGSVTSVGQPLIGAELNIGLADLSLAGADMVIVGHIHCPQEHTFGGVPMLYTGSPFRTSFGETEQKSIVVAELGGGRARGVEWARIPTPATQMLLIETVWEHDEESGAATFDLLTEPYPPADMIRGAEIRFRYSVEADRRDAAKRFAASIRDRLVADGAIHVKVEEQVIAHVRARAPEVAAAKTLEDKLQAYWAMRRLGLDPARVETLLTKTHQLEEEAAA